MKFKHIIDKEQWYINFKEDLEEYDL